MKFKWLLQIVISGLLVIALGGCITSDYPLPDSPSCIMDTRILGTWKVERNEKEVGRLNIAAISKYKYKFQDTLDEESLGTFTCSLVNGQRYYNVLYVDQNHSYHIFRLSLKKDNEMIVLILEPNVIADAILAGEISGKIDDWGYMKHLSATPKELKTFFASHDPEKLFTVAYDGSEAGKRYFIFHRATEN